MIITIIFYLYSDIGPHIVRGPLRPLTLVTFTKKIHSLIFQYSRFSRIFSYFFYDFSKSHSYAATYRHYATYRPLRSVLAAGRYACRYRYFHPCLSLSLYIFMVNFNNILKFYSVGKLNFSLCFLSGVKSYPS